MFKSLIVAFGAAVLIGASIVPPAHAQTAGGTVGVGPDGATTARQDRERAGRTPRAGGTPRAGRGRGQRPAPPADPAVVMAEAQAVLTGINNGCNVTEASLLGLNNEREKIYEVACAAGTGPGYMMVAKTPPAAPELVDCVVLAGQAQRTRETNPEAPAETCDLPGNQNPLAVISGYAQAAGVTCSVDQGMAVGRNNAGVDVYEIGCNGADGYWIEKAADGWDKTECTILVSQGGQCRFTTAGEIASSFKSRLATSAANDCDVTQVRYMGANSNGAFYEAKCAAEGTGYIARVNADGAVQQVYACATAQRIGGGCTLTPAPAAAPAAPSGE